MKKLSSRVFLRLPFVFIAYVAAATLFEPLLDTPFKNAPRPIIGALREPLENLPQIENFEIVGYNPLPNPEDTMALGRSRLRTPQRSARFDLRERMHHAVVVLRRVWIGTTSTSHSHESL